MLGFEGKGFEGKRNKGRSSRWIRGVEAAWNSCSNESGDPADLALVDIARASAYVAISRHVVTAIRHGARLANG